MKKYRDYYFLKAKEQNFPARSIYKLQEIDNRFKIFKPGIKVLDLGASPGSWSLGALQKLGPEGRIIACDLKRPEIVFPEQIHFFQEDILTPTEEFCNLLAQTPPFQVIMSDMAPATTGNKATDQYRSFELAFTAFQMAKKYLFPTGAFITKIFMGPDVDSLTTEMRSCFEKVKTFKPKSSRSESKEIFLIGISRFKSV